MMNKEKFISGLLLGIIAGIVALGILRWLGLNLSLANLFYAVFGEPTVITGTIFILFTGILIFFIVRSAYRKYPKS